MGKPKESGNGRLDGPRRSGKIRRAAEWCLLIGAVLCAAVVGLSVVRSFWPTQKESRQPARPQSVSPKPAAATPRPTYVPPTTVEALKQEALTVARQLLSDFPDAVGPTALMGITHEKLGESAEALKCWETCVQLDPNCLVAYYGMGRLALRKGETPKAVALCRKVLQLDPDQPGVHEQLGEALLSLGKPDEAITELQKQIENDPKAVHSHFLLGQAYRQLKAYEKAKASYEAALQIFPDSADACFGLVTVCARLGQKDQAKQYREKFEKLKAGKLQAVADQHKAYDDLLLTRQRVGHIYTDVGRYYGTHGSTAKAEELWHMAALLDPKNARCRRQLTELYETARRDREALNVCEELCEIEPKNVLLLAHLGVLNVRLKRFDEAERAFRKMVRIAPQRHEGYSGLAQLHVRTKTNAPEAKTLAERAVALAPTAKNYSILGVVCQQSGDRPGALSAWKRAVELDPDNTTYTKMYEQLQRKQ